MKIFERISQTTESHEQLIFCNDPATGLKAIICIHDSTLGPGTGGCRMYPYATEEQALDDVLRLSKGMTYKASISGLKLGGAKAVIIGDPKTTKTPALLKRYAEFVKGLNGRYITAKDVGINGKDLQYIHQFTSHVLGIEGDPKSSGDPSPLTAWGTYNGMKACAKHLWGDASLKGKTIAVQGLGYVAYFLIDYLVKEGAQIIAADVDSAAIDRAKKKFNLKIVEPNQILEQACDILSPNALGAVLNKNSISKIKAKIIAGAANNQLETDEDGYELMRRNIVYAPDYAINAGGLMNIYHELEGYNESRAYDHVAGIYRTIEEILTRAAAEKQPPHKIADKIAEERIKAAKK